MTTASSLQHSVVEGFAARFGETPDSLWSAPGRVNLIGEHTDYNDGFVLPFAIDRRTVMALRKRDDRVIRIATSFAPEVVEIAIDDISPETVGGWSAYPLGMVWGATEFGSVLDAAFGFDAYLESDIPVGAGLSSSAALESVFGLAITELWSLGYDRQSIARIGQFNENQVVGAPTGIMDQSASLLGEQDSVVLLDCRSLDASVIPLGLSDAQLTIAVIDTKVTHEHATGGYAARRASCELGAKLLGVTSLRDLTVDDLPRASRELDDETFRRVRHVITENERVLETVRTLRDKGATAIGPLLDASHVSMRDDFEISVPELDLAVTTAQQHGAIGARMTGGGFGGSAIAVIPSSRVEALRTATLAAFAAAGYATPDVFTVTPTRGAARESLS
ncbi:galactokinase [Herbiconiux ginsengi]|uniref:Galactokinase n=1 Tax=Herbiconiux ginsengi TaxID=381665 RepID=A0A1H3TL18_9MICO|nr:galactokinase [Herbiconiux ginsengi]SDZ50982.1 galactokinase [Herbiconiux ginsengi]